MATTADTIPSARTTDLMRLTYPAKWRNEGAARRFVTDNNLTQAGVHIVEEAPSAWRVVIDTDRAAQITPWLRTQYPGILWAVSWAPTP